MLLVLAAGVVVLTVRRLLGTWRLGATAAVALLTALAAAAASHLPDVGMFPAALYAASAIGTLLVIGLGSVIGIAFLKTPMPRRGLR